MVKRVNPRDTFAWISHSENANVVARTFSQEIKRNIGWVRWDNKDYVYVVRIFPWRRLSLQVIKKSCSYVSDPPPFIIAKQQSLNHKTGFTKAARNGMCPETIQPSHKSVFGTSTFCASLHLLVPIIGRRTEGMARNSRFNKTHAICCWIRFIYGTRTTTQSHIENKQKIEQLKVSQTPFRKQGAQMDRFDLPPRLHFGINRSGERERETIIQLNKLVIISPSPCNIVLQYKCNKAFSLAIHLWLWLWAKSPTLYISIYYISISICVSI